MRGAFNTKQRRNAQTLVFFLLTWGTIMLLAGLAIDSGLLYLAKARLARAVDGAALVAVGNFNRNSDPATNRNDVAVIMRNFATANYTDLATISATATGGGTATQYPLPSGGTGTSYTYNFNDGTHDPNGQYRRFVEVKLNTGSGGAITSATCNARCPVQTYFIGYGWAFLGGAGTSGGTVTNTGAKIGGFQGPSGLVDLKVSSGAVATRNPRLIMVVIDRSASMLAQGGGATGLPPAIVQFLDFFDTSSDNIGIVSFGSSARLEMPMTTNFIYAGTNVLYDAYNTQTNAAGQDINHIPGIDPESVVGRTQYDPNYNSTGVRRLKFGGQTAADDGIRLGLETMMANAGFNDPDVTKYLVIFTDGKWNASRTLVAAPYYINEAVVPALSASVAATNFVANAFAVGWKNGQECVTNGAATNYGPWQYNVTNDMTANANLYLLPNMSPLPGVTNAIGKGQGPVDFTNLIADHYADVWQSRDKSGVEPLLNPSPTQIQGAPLTNIALAIAGTDPTNAGITYYTHDFDVWLQPGSVAYAYTNAAAIASGTYTAYVSDYTKPTKHIYLRVDYGGKVDLVVPGYIADGVIFDVLDLPIPDNSNYPRYRADNYHELYMWPDDHGGNDTNGEYYSISLQRQLMFRNYANLMTGFYVFRPDEPLGAGLEPLITEYTHGAPRARYGLGPYYPSAGFYWPFGGETNSLGIVTNAVGVDTYESFALMNPNSGLPSEARHISWSINMLSSNAAPEWAGELFYKSSSGAGTNTISGNSTTSASEIMQSDDWQVGAPAFVSALSSVSGLMYSEPTHNANIPGGPSVWRPLTFSGSNLLASTVGPGTGNSATLGFVSDGAGHTYKDAMAWSGRPTHYYDFSLGKWMPIENNHNTNAQFLQLGNWKAWEYAWHARALGVTIYTIGYGSQVTAAQCAFLAQIANATNSISPGSPFATNDSVYNPNQPIGQQFYATNSAQISNDFFSVGQAINAALTQ